MTGLTFKQSRCLGFLRTYSDAHGGVMPSQQEIAAFLGISSKSGAWRILDGLARRGVIIRMRGKSRAIRLVERDRCTSCGQTITKGATAHAA